MISKCYLIFLIFLSSIVVNLPSGIDYAAEEARFCKDVNFEKLLSSGDERLKLRDKHEPHLSINYDDVVKARKDNEYTGLTSPKLITAILFTFITFLLAIIVFWIFCCNLCCCKKNDSATPFKAKFYFITNIVLLVFSIAFFGCYIYYAIETEKHITDIQCMFAKFPKDIIIGNEATGVFFIGFQPFVNMLESFVNQIDSIDSVT